MDFVCQTRAIPEQAECLAEASIGERPAAVVGYDERVAIRGQPPHLQGVPQGGRRHLLGIEHVEYAREDVDFAPSGADHRPGSVTVDLEDDLIEKRRLRPFGRSAAN